MVNLSMPVLNPEVMERLEKELMRFPYLSDEYRNPARIKQEIEYLFSIYCHGFKYDGGYFFFREVSRGHRADLFWIHFKDQKFTHEMVRVGASLVNAAMESWDLRRVTLKTADPRVARLASHMGFEREGHQKYGMKHGGKYYDMILMAVVSPPKEG